MLEGGLHPIAFDTTFISYVDSAPGRSFPGQNTLWGIYALKPHAAVSRKNRIAIHLAQIKSIVSHIAISYVAIAMVAE